MQKYAVYKIRSQEEIDEAKKQKAAGKLEAQIEQGYNYKHEHMVNRINNSAIMGGNRVLQQKARKISGNFVIDNIEGKSIKILNDYLGYQYRSDTIFNQAVVTFFLHQVQIKISIIIFFLITTVTVSN